MDSAGRGEGLGTLKTWASHFRSKLEPISLPPQFVHFSDHFFSTVFLPICCHICGQGSFYISPILFSASTEHFQLLLRTFSNRFLLDFSRFAVVFAAMGRFIFVTSNSSASAERFSFFCALFHWISLNFWLDLRPGVFLYLPQHIFSLQQHCPESALLPNLGK